MLFLSQSPSRRLSRRVAVTLGSLHVAQQIALNALSHTTAGMMDGDS
jgi:hypothetical protein